MTAILLDTETTGIDEPDVIELAWLPLVTRFEPSSASLLIPGLPHDLPGGWFRFRPRKPITLGAMAAHHIIEGDLVDQPEWSGSWELPGGTDYVVAHNVDFDHRAIGSPPVKRICTLALARKLWPTLDSHSLAALTYHLMPHAEAREALKGAHSAMVDARLCHRLLVAELALMPAIASWERLWAASEKARVPTHFTFGKFGPQNGQPGRPIAEIRQMDPSYIDWCLTKCDQCKDEYWQRALRGEVA
ncbi:MAG: 3'-5' exonuclease [Candidatus Acidiferrales bacterium]